MILCIAKITKSERNHNLSARYIAEIDVTNFIPKNTIFAFVITDKSKTVAFTGHRSFKMAGGGLFLNSWDDIAVRLDSALRGVIAEGYTDFLCGMAEGFDLMAGEAVVRLRDEFPNLRLVAVLPFPEQSRGFDSQTKARYDALMAASDEIVTVRPTYTIDCFHARNDFLVDNGSVLICYYNGSLGGTRYTVRRALQHQRRIINM